jgi:hypothetical protein
MVKAQLDGTKTQTRRLLTRNNTTVNGESWRGKTCPWEGLRLDESMVRDTSPLSGQRDPHLAVPFCHPNDEPAPSDECGIYTVRPVFEIGDRLWVREAWARTSVAPIVSTIDNPIVVYRESDSRTDYGGPWKPGIHMPRAASRLTLTVTDVRVQRLNECSEADALSEGVVWSDQWHGYVVPGVEHPNKDFPVLSRPTAREMYAALWDVINGSGAWLANPWVIATTSTVEQRNIDA